MFFKLIHSSEGKRPQINFNYPQNASIDWEPASAVIEGKLPVEDYTPLHIFIKNKAYQKWHAYMDGGMCGMFSAEFIHSWDDDVFAYYSFLPIFLNESVYYFLRRNELVDCLDRARSDLVYYPHDPSRIMTINTYAFTSSVPKHRFFSIPEFPSQIFAPQELQRRFQRNPFQGVEFIQLPQLDDFQSDQYVLSPVLPSDHLLTQVYKNPYLGIRIGFPERWDLSDYETMDKKNPARVEYQEHPSDMPQVVGRSLRLFTGRRWLSGNQHEMEAEIELSIFRHPADKQFTDLIPTNNVKFMDVNGTHFEYVERDLSSDRVNKFRFLLCRLDRELWYSVRVHASTEYAYQEALTIFSGLRIAKKWPGDEVS